MPVSVALAGQGCASFSWSERQRFFAFCLRLAYVLHVLAGWPLLRVSSHAFHVPTLSVSVVAARPSLCAGLAPLAEWMIVNGPKSVVCSPYPFVGNVLAAAGNERSERARSPIVHVASRVCGCGAHGSS